MSCCRAQADESDEEDWGPEVLASAYMATKSVASTNTWIFDSGAWHSVCDYKKSFVSLKHLKRNSRSERRWEVIRSRSHDEVCFLAVETRYRPSPHTDDRARVSRRMTISALARIHPDSEKKPSLRQSPCQNWVTISYSHRHVASL